jgi:DNA replication protein DnaC
MAPVDTQQPAAAAEASGTSRPPASGWKRLGDGLAEIPNLTEPITPELPGDQWAEVEPSLGPDGMPYCGTCRGYRFLRYDVAVTDPNFGQIRRCTDCQDLSRAERLTRAATIAGLSEEQRLKTFASFKPSKGAHQAVQAAANFAQQPAGWLVIHGEPGSGKTHLSLAVANALIARERVVVWWYGADLGFEAQRRIGQGTQFDFLADLRTTPVLIIDDLGTARGTEYRIGDVLEPLFDARYRNRLPTLVTLIGDPEAVKDHLSESIGRRMQDRTVCTVIQNQAPQWSE